MTTLVVHPHFHPRRTGVTRHVETVVPLLAPAFDSRVMGRTLPETLPRIFFPQVRDRAGRELVIWHAHRNNELLAGMAMRAQYSRLRVVATRHSATVPSLWTRALFKRADARIALTPFVAQQLGLPCEIISHGVDVNLFRPPADRSHAWEQLAFGGARGIAVIGRLREEKGQGDFVDAIAPLMTQYPEWRALLVGHLKSEDEVWARQMLSKTPVTHVKEVADIRPIYQGVSVVVHPSLGEANSMVLLEAMASGCCVIATRLPHVDTVVEHGVSGLLYEPGDVSTLRSHLSLAMTQPNEVRRMGEEARRRAETQLSLTKEIDALSALYRSFER